jgi:hypothetical protein
MIMVALLLCATANQLWSARLWGHESFQMTEWLINYSGGFVRRGLTGTVIMFLSRATGLQANYIVIAISASTYLALVIWLLRRAVPSTPAILLLSCVLVGFPAYQDGIVRKDCLGLLVLVFCSSLAAANGTALTRIIGINAAACLAILVHETWAFYTLPALVLLRRPSDESVSASKVFLRSALLIPAWVSFGLVAMYHGTPEVAKAIHQSWMPLWQSIGSTVIIPETPAAAMEGIGWTSQQGIHLSLYIFQTGLYQPMAWLMVIIISFFLCIWFQEIDKSGGADQIESKSAIAALLVFQFASISPLFILGVDWGRWLFFWLVSSIILRTLGYRAPRWLENFIGRLLKAMRMDTFFSRFRAPDWILLLFGFPVCWSMLNFLTAGPLLRHLYSVVSCFR